MGRESAFTEAEADEMFAHSEAGADGKSDIEACGITFD